MAKKDVEIPKEVSTFFTVLQEKIKAQVPNGLRKFESRVSKSGYIQIWFSEHSYHYEIALRPHKVRVGLDLEGNEEKAKSVLTVYKKQEKEIKAKLPHAIFEENRIYEELGFEEDVMHSLAEPKLIDKVATLAAQYISVLRSPSAPQETHETQPKPKPKATKATVENKIGGEKAEVETSEGKTIVVREAKA